MNFDESILTKAENNQRTGPSRSPVNGRRALAPLEVVLVLPLLMAFMGIIILWGYAASWKIRSEVVARDVAWKLRYPRHGSFTHPSLTDKEGSSVFELHERSPEWPVRRDDNEMLESYRSGDQRISSYANDEVVAAPLIRGVLPEVEVNNDVLDFTRSISRGLADISRPSPIMAETGRVNFLTPNSFMDDEFQYRRMGWSSPGGTGFSMGRGGGSRRVAGFAGRRIPVLWELELDFLYDDGAISSGIFAINSFRDPIVMAIDEDMDYYTWRRRTQHWRFNPQIGRYKYFDLGEPLPVPPNPGSYAYIPDFSHGVSVGSYNHERRTGRAYELDRQWVLENIVQPYVDRLSRKPIDMAQASIDLYQLVLRRDDDELCSPALTQAERSRLESWIDQLETYVERKQNGF